MSDQDQKKGSQMKLNLRSALGASLGMFACVALAVPGQALAKEKATSTATSASTSSSNAVANASNARKQHCMKVEALTGSRMAKTKCKTIAEWEALGYEFKSDR